MNKDYSCSEAARKTEYACYTEHADRIPSVQGESKPAIAYLEQMEEVPLLSGPASSPPPDGDTGHNGDTLEGSVGSTQLVLATALLASHMLPLIRKFSREVQSGEGETFKDWIELMR